MEKCKISGCNKKVKAQGFCFEHYVLYVKDKIDILGLSKKEKPIKLPSLWSSRTLANKITFINETKNIKLLECIGSEDRSVKKICKERIIELGGKPKFIKKCKVPGCNKQGYITRGFCHRHYMRFINGIIDEDGNEIRPLIPYGDRNRTKCKVEDCHKQTFKKCFCEQHYFEYSEGLRNIYGERTQKYRKKKYKGLPLTHFNKIVRDLVDVKMRLRELRKYAFSDKNAKKDFFKQISFLEDSLKFIHNPSFIFGCIDVLNNMTLKALLGGEKDKPMNIDIELTEDHNIRQFKGILIKGNNANIAITEYELINEKKKDAETVLFLRDVIDSRFPFECKAADTKGNIIHHIKITESE